MTNYIPTCDCVSREGYKTILHNRAFVGITTRLRENGTFIDNMAATAENRFCPQCGRAREIIEEKEGEEKL